MLELIPAGRAVSIEREVFPQLCAEGSVYGLSLPGYWLDVGTPESYLQAHHDVLERRFRTEVGDELGSDYTLVAASARVHPDARLVPPVYIGANAEIGAGACVGSLAVDRRRRRRRGGSGRRVVRGRSGGDRRRRLDRQRLDPR